MKNLKKIAELSKSARPDNKLPIYYDFSTQEVLTSEMLENHLPEHLMLCTELINPNTTKEIEAAVHRALWM